MRKMAKFNSAILCFQWVGKNSLAAAFIIEAGFWVITVR
jgi:hypothetical protein